VDDASCVCDGWTPQNAAHLYECPWVGDGQGRTRESIFGDEEWCEEVARFCCDFVGILYVVSR